MDGAKADETCGDGVEVEVLLARTRKSGLKEYFVTFAGVDKRYDKWINQQELKALVNTRAKRRGAGQKKKRDAGQTASSQGGISPTHSVHASLPPRTVGG